MERKFNFSIGEYYHVYNRGTNKSIIFNNDADRNRFVKLLFICNSAKPVVFKSIQGLPLDKIDRGETLVDIGAYCLMPNHFHLLLREKVDKGISVFLSKLLTSYSMYFNKKNDRTGVVFEGPFKSTYVDTDQYLKYLFAYIHLNPVKIIDPKWKENGIKDSKAAQKYLNTYGYSSYFDYALDTVRDESVILNKVAFPEYFTNTVDFNESISEWLSFDVDTV